MFYIKYKFVNYPYFEYIHNTLFLQIIFHLSNSLLLFTLFWENFFRKFVVFCYYCARLNYNNISTISDLDKFLDTKKKDLNELRNQKKSISRQISKIEGIISHAERKKELDEVYKKAHTPGFGKKKYIAEHASELSEWETCNKYLRINLHDEDYNPKALKSKQERLQCKLTDIVNKTNSLKEELDLMSYTRYIIKDYIPELVSDNKTITESQRTEKKESLREKLREKQDNVMHRSSGNSINRNKKEHDLQ